MHKLLYFVTLILILTMATMGVYIWQNEQDKQQLKTLITATPEPTPEEMTTPLTDIPQPSPAKNSSQSASMSNGGTITGSLSFPSEVVPNLEVCAEDTTTKQEICTTEILQEPGYTYGKGYRLDVPVGTYYVFAKLANDPYKAYYDEFVTCGLQASCTSHTPIPVVVTQGETVSGIDPQDWYNQ